MRYVVWNGDAYVMTKFVGPLLRVFVTIFLKTLNFSEMASRKRLASVRKDDEIASKTKRNVIMNGGDEDEENDGFYTGVTITEQDLEQLASGKPIPPPVAEGSELLKLNRRYHLGWLEYVKILIF